MTPDSQGHVERTITRVRNRHLIGGVMAEGGSGLQNCATAGKNGKVREWRAARSRLVELSDGG